MNLYRRPLLSDLPLDRFIELQMEAIEYLEDLDSTNMDLKMAICKRLNLREQLLRAVNPEAVLLEENGNQWNTCQELTQTLSNDHSLATLVPDAYSMKLQRRLTTTTPPRPVVEIPFKEAMAYLSMLCLGCKGTYHIMSYHGFATMLVRYQKSCVHIFMAKSNIRILYDFTSPESLSLQFTLDVCFRL